MKWNKLEVKPLPIEEQTEHSYKTMWEGPVPEINEEVLVTVPSCRGGFVDTYTDTWMEFDNGVGFEYTDDNIIYWMKMPKYNGELEDLQKEK